MYAISVPLHAYSYVKYCVRLYFSHIATHSHAIGCMQVVAMTCKTRMLPCTRYCTSQHDYMLTRQLHVDAAWNSLLRSR